jgi:hypothetical protein
MKSTQQSQIEYLLKKQIDTRRNVKKHDLIFITIYNCSAIYMTDHNSKEDFSNYSVYMKGSFRKISNMYSFSILQSI